jgi:hypothetical protein
LGKEGLVKEAEVGLEEVESPRGKVGGRRLLLVVSRGQRCLTCLLLPRNGTRVSIGATDVACRVTLSISAQLRNGSWQRTCLIT